MNPLFRQNSIGAQNVNFLRQNVSVKGDIVQRPINLTRFFWTISSFNYFPHYRCTFQATGGGGEGGNISDSETGSSAFDFEEDTNTLVVIFRFERETLHCWTMVSEWYEASRTLKLAVVLTSVTFIIFITAFFSPYWLQSVPSEKLPNPKFTNLGKFAKEQFPLLYWSSKSSQVCGKYVWMDFMTRGINGTPNFMAANTYYWKSMTSSGTKSCRVSIINSIFCFC